MQLGKRIQIERKMQTEWWRPGGGVLPVPLQKTVVREKFGALGYWLIMSVLLRDSENSDKMTS